jgi:hypothetical protein
VATAVPAAEPGQTARAPGAPSVAVSRGVVTSCRTAAGESLKGGDCGALAGLDGIVLPRLRKLVDCPAAAGASGKLHLAIRADFARGSISADLGHGAPIPAADAILACARAELRGASLASLAHDNARYSVGYGVTFGAADAEPAAAPATPPAAALPAPAAAADGADAVVPVAWDVALVRDAPRTGKVVARLPRGTPLRAGTAAEGWVPVKYGDQFSSEGWVYHSAIGR